MFVQLYKTSVIGGIPADGLGSNIRIYSFGYSINSNEIVGIRDCPHRYEGKVYYEVALSVSDMYSDRYRHEELLIDEESYKAMKAEK